MKRARTALHAATLVLWFLATSCAQVLNLDSFEQSSAGTLAACGGLPYANDACGTCMMGCCTEAASCMSEGVCSATQACYSKCEPGDAACIGACNVSIPYDTRAERTLEQCAQTKCNADCQLGCGHNLSPSVGRCFQQQPGCCDVEAQLYASPEAMAWADCQSHCHSGSHTLRGDTADQCGCLSAHPAAEPLASAMTRCMNACITVEPDWSCVGSVQWPSNNDSADGTIAFQASIYDVQTYKPVPNISVDACTTADANCLAPVASRAMTDAAGHFAFPSLSHGLAGVTDYFGYLLLRGEPYRDTAFFYFPPDRQTNISALVLLSKDTFKAAATILGVTPNPEHGSLALFVQDCNYFSPAAGLSITTDPELPVAYFRNGLPDLTATSTDAGGQILVFDLPPGRLHVTSTRQDTKQIVGELDLIVRANTHTTGSLPPTPLVPRAP